MCAALLYTGHRSKVEGSALGAGNGKLPAASQLPAAALNALSAHIAVIDARGVIVAVNDAWRAYADENGMRWARYGVGHSYLAVLDSATQVDEGIGEIARGVRHVLEGRSDSYRTEYACSMPGGCHFLQQVTAFEHGGTRHAIISHENVTAQKLSEAELRGALVAAETARLAEAARLAQLENRLRAAEAAADLLAIAASAGPIEDTLQRMAERVRAALNAEGVAIYAAEDRWDQPVQVAGGWATRPDRRKRAPEIPPAVLARSLADPQGAGIDDAWAPDALSTGRTTRSRRPTYRGLLVTPIQRKEGLYGYLVAFYAAPQSFCQDDFELGRRVAGQMTLALENARLRDQAERVAVANERNRLARELHDAVTQTLFSTSIVAEALPRVWEREPAEGQRALEDLRLWTRGALAEMRTLLMELRPAALLDRPLGDLIRLLGEAAATRLLIPVSCEIATEVEPPAQVRLALYRTVQEALNNVGKHARASHISILYGVQGDGVQLCVVDDGCGFEAGAATHGRMGLGIMRERAEHIGATLSIRSTPGAGTEVSFEWAPPVRKSW